MKILKREILDSFTAKYAATKSWVDNWVAAVSEASWKSPVDIKARYRSASILPENVIIFNVKGNAYRLEVSVSFGAGVVLIRWAGTHADYTKRYS